MNNEKKINFTKNYISPTIIDSKIISKVNQKYLKDDNYDKTPTNVPGKLKYNFSSLEKKNILKVIPYNINSNNNNNINNTSKADNNINNFINNINIPGSNSIDYKNYSNGNIYLNVKSNNINSNLNYLTSYQENSFINKPYSGSGSALICKKNQELNFSTKITDSNSSLRETIGVYSINKKVILKGFFHLIYIIDKNILIYTYLKYLVIKKLLNNLFRSSLRISKSQLNLIQIIQVHCIKETSQPV